MKLYYESKYKPKYSSSELQHHGIKGMKWGVRRFQEKDGSLTAAGRKRYLDDKTRKIQKDIDSYDAYRKTGIKDKKGRMMVSADEIKEIVKGLETQKAKVEAKAGEKYDKAANKVALKQQKNAEKAKEYQDKADAKRERISDLEKKGVKSDVFTSKYGKASTDMPEAAFVFLNGKTKKQAIEELIRKDKEDIAVYEKAAKDKAAGKLTDAQKMLIGAGCVAVALTAAYAGHRYLKGAELKRLSNLKGGDDISYKDFFKKYMDSESRLFEAVSRDAYSQLSDVDVKLTSGQVFHRISTSDEQSLTYKMRNMFGGEFEVTKDRLYLAFTEEDVTRYKAMLPKYWWKQWGMGGQQGYDVAYKAMTDINAPSAKKRIDVYTELIKTDLSVRRMAEQAYTLSSGKGSMRVMDDEELSRSTYNWLSGSLANTANDAATKYINKLKSMGYNAIVDDNDAGRLSDMPMIIFDPVKNVVRQGAEALTNDKIEAAANSLKEVMNRK